MRIATSLLVSTLVFVCGVQCSLASTVTYRFTGTVTSSSQTTIDPNNANSLPSELAVGSPVTGTVEYKTEDFEPGENRDFFNLTSYRYNGNATSQIMFQFGSTIFKGEVDTALISDAQTRAASGSQASDRVVFGANHSTPVFGGNEAGILNFTLEEMITATNSQPNLVSDEKLPTGRESFDLTNATITGQVTGLDNTSLDVYNVFFSVDPGNIEILNDTSSLNYPRVISNLREDGPLPISSEFAIDGDIGSRRFDENSPTVIITHGRQPGGTGSNFFSFGRYNGDPFLVAGMSEAYDAIKGEYPNTNVILLTWEGAFVRRAARAGALSSFVDPLADVHDVGVGAANLFSQLVGEYNGPIHLIGHSYGTAVNNSLALELANKQFNIERLTVLDAPFDLTGSSDLLYGNILDETSYAAVAQAAQVQYFENYYGTKRSILSLDPAFGAPIPGAILADGYALNTGHFETFEEYIASVDNSSAELSALGGGYNAGRASNPLDDQKNGLKAVSVDLSSVSAFLNSSFDVSNSTASLAEGSDAYLLWDETSLLEFEAFSFTLDELVLGAEDWFEVQIGGLTSVFFDRDTQVFGSEVFVPLSSSAIENSSLAFIISGNGDVDASARLSNFRAWSFSSVSPVAPVPSPTSALLFFPVFMIFSTWRLLVGLGGRSNGK